MPKIFYTERDIEDLYHSGVTTLVVNDDVVITDLGREKARKLGVELLKENDQPSSAPIRPYITEHPCLRLRYRPLPRRPWKTACCHLFRIKLAIRLMPVY